MRGDAQDRRERSVLPIAAPVPAAPTAVDVRDQSLLRPQPGVRAPEGAPNVLVILVDDMGFGTSAAFGGPCEMSAAQRLAEGGLRYSCFHTTAICSPTRAALMTA